MNYLYKAMMIYIGIGCMLSGCNNVIATPNETLSNYLDAFLHGRMTEAYEHISQKDKSVVSIDEYVEKQNMNKNVIAEAFATEISYTIDQITVTGNEADATVSITLPDFSSVFSDVMRVAFMSAFGGANENDIKKMIEEKYKDKEIPMTTTTQTFKLLNESEGWKVFLDFEKQKKVSALLEEAKNLREKKKLSGALKKYEEVLELDSEEVTAKSGERELTKEISDFEQKQAYVDKVKLYDFTAKYFSTYTDEKTPGVIFKIKNMGDKTLSKIEVTVYFKDASNNTIAEESYRPVNEHSFGDSKPLKPNYIWQMERSKFYTAESVPSEWQEGNAVAKITDIEFKEAVELDSEEVTAKSGENELNKEISDFEQKQAYVDKVKLYEFTAKYFSTYTDKNTPGVTFKIKNEGDKTLTKIEVTVYFKDAFNNTIAEEDFHPVFVSEYSFRDNKPLKPNYIWQMERGKFYTAESVPSEWQEGNAVAKITNIEFE